MHRRALLSTLTGGILGSSGCFHGAVDEEQPLERAAERVDGSWRMRHGDAGNTRFADVDGVEEPSHEWTTTVGLTGTVDPLVSDSLVITTDPSADSVATIEAANGERNQTVGLDGVEGTPLAVLDGTAFVLDSRGRLVARDIDSGERRWQYSLGWLPGGLSATATTLYVAVPANTEIVAIDREDGAERWQYDFVRSPGKVTASDQNVLVSMDEHLFAIDGGERRWNRRYDADIRGLLLEEGHAFVATESGVVSKVATSGDLEWTVSIGDAVRHAALATETLFASTASGIVAIDRATGTANRLGATELARARLTACRDRLYAANASSVVSLDTDDGETVDRATLDQTVVAGPTILDGLVLLRTNDGSADEPRERLTALTD